MRFWNFFTTTIVAFSIVIIASIFNQSSTFMLPRIINFGRSVLTGGFNNGGKPLSSAITNQIQGQPVEPTVPTAIQARNSTSDATITTTATKMSNDIATFANGCFWGTEDIFRKYYGGGKGLLDAKVGYIGGKESSKNPSYEEVCTGRTGHAEATQIEFDPKKVSYAELVEFFYRSHDPTQKDRQGPDRGTQYRSAIFTHSAEQDEVAKKVTEEVQQKHFTPKQQKIVTQIEQRPASSFFVAEEYHQKYLENNPSGYHCPTHRLWW